MIKWYFCWPSSFPGGAGALVRRALLGMGLAVGQCMLSTVWYVLYCWCDTGAGWGLARHLLVAVGALQSHTVS